MLNNSKIVLKNRINLNELDVSRFLMIIVLFSMSLLFVFIIDASLVFASSGYNSSGNLSNYYSTNLSVNNLNDWNNLSEHLSLKITKPTDYGDVSPYVIISLDLNTNDSYNVTNSDVNNITSAISNDLYNILINSTNISSYCDLVVYLYANGEARKYVYNDLLLFPINFDITTNGKYIFMLVDKSDQSIISTTEFLPEENFNWILANDTLNISQISQNVSLDNIYLNISGFNNTDNTSDAYDINNSILLNSTVVNISEESNKSNSTQFEEFEDIVLDKSAYSINEPVKVIITNKISDSVLSTASLIISYGEETFKYVGTQRESIFIPTKNGNYTLILKDDFSNEILYLTQFFVNSSELISENSAEILSDYRRMSVTNSKGSSLFGNIIVNDIRVEQRDVEIVKQGFFTKTTQMVRQDIQIAKIAKLDLNGVEGFDASEISFNNLELSNTNLDLRLEHISPKFMNAKRGAFSESQIIESYAMDLSTLNFDNGTLTRIAKGNVLWKCKEWDYDNQHCMGEWVKVQDIIPGQEYTIGISPVDPGYIETGVATINTKKSIYRPSETAEIIIVVLDTNGYLVSSAKVYLDIINPQGSVTTLSTDNGQIFETTRGIYRAVYDQTQIVGNYSLNVRAVKRTDTQSIVPITEYSKTQFVDSSMSSYFTVMSEPEFDIIRDAPVTIDPFHGPFSAAITVNQNIALDYYNLTEVIPSNVEVIEATGAAVYTDEYVNKTYLQWSNLQGNNTVNYLLQAPLVTPDILVLGKAIIHYVVNGVFKIFEEARPWYIAVDPEVSTDQGIVIYADRTNIGVLKYRNWSDDTLMAEQSSSITTGQNIVWTKMKCLDYSTKCLWVGLDSGNDMDFAVFNSTDWSFSNHIAIFNNGISAEQSFDMECEANSQQCILAYENLTTDNQLFMYRLWNGTALGSEQRYNITIAEVKSFTWIKLYPQKGTNNIGIVLQNDMGGTSGTPAIYGGIWNGTNFTNWQTFTTNGASDGSGRTNYRHFDCAWEGVANGRLICMYSNDTINAVLGYAFNGTAWQNLGSVYNGVSEPWQFSLCGRKETHNFNHSYIGVMFCDSASNLNGGIWNGTAFNNTDSSKTLTANTNAECGANQGAAQYGQNFLCEFENSGDQMVYAWVNVAGDRFLTSGTYTKSSNRYSMNNWSSGTKIVATGANELRHATMNANSFNDQIFLTYNDAARDGGCSLWRGRVWDGAGCNNAQTFETDGASASSGWLNFEWFRLRLEPAIIINRPTITISYFNFAGATTGGQTEAAYNGTTIDLPPLAANSPISGTEFTAPCYYAASELDDDLWCSVNTTSSTANTRVYQSYKFEITDPTITAFSLDLIHEGYARRTTSFTSEDFRIYVYNWTSDTYILKRTVYGGGGGDVYSETLIEGNMDDYVVNNSLYILLENVNGVVGGGGGVATRFAEINTNFIEVESSNTQVWRGNQIVNVTAIDRDNVSSCFWSFYNGSRFINSNTTMSLIGGYYINVTNTSLVSDGAYTLYAFCNDTSNNIRNATVAVRVDNTPPSITLISPANESNATVNYALLKWNVTDFPKENMLCNVTIDSVLRTPYNIVSRHGLNVSQNFTNLVDGTHYWNVTCIDVAGNVNTSLTWKFDTDTAGPIVSINYPSTGLFINNRPLDLNFTPTDVHTIVNCSLYLDNIRNTTLYNLTSAVVANVTFGNLTQGLHRWNVTCFDSFGFSNKSINANFTYDFTVPIVYLNITTNTLFNGTAPKLNYTVIDNIDTNLTCNITVNDEIIDPNIPSVNNTLISRTESLLDGYKSWYVTCIDDAGNFNVSETRLFRVIGGPFVNLTSPANGTINNGSNVTLSYYTRDGDGVVNCSLYINAVLNQTNSTLPGSDTTGTNSSFFINDFSQGTYIWYVLCYDSNNMTGLSQNFTIISDRSVPNIILNAPSPGLLLNISPAVFNFTFNDSYSINASCNLTIDSNISTTNRNFNANNGSVTSKSEVVSNGIHYWNITCIDRGNNFVTSATRNFTMNVTFPISVTVVADKIIYQENELVYINTTMRNDSNGLMATNLTLDYIYTNNTYTDLPWWNTSFIYRRPIYINETQNSLRTQRPIPINLTFDFGEISSCNNLRIIDDLTLTPVSYNYLSGDGIYTCNLIFNATVSANAVNEQNYHVYFGNKSLISDPGYSNLLIKKTLFSDLFTAGTLNPNWINSTNWNVLNNNPTMGFGNNAHVNGTITNSTLTLNQTLPLSLYDNVNISFVWRIDTWTSASTFIFEYSNNSGSSWTGGLGVAYLTGTGDNNLNRNFSQTLNTTYTVDSFGLRFRVISTVAANDGGFDNFNVSAYNNIAINVSTRVGNDQVFVERLVNLTNTTGVFNTNWTTLGRTSGNYSAAVYATTSNTKFRPGSGYDWFTIIADTFGPTIALISPQNGMTNRTGTYIFYYNASDLANNITACNLIINNVLNQTNSTISETITNNFTLISIGEGKYNWSVNCTDSLGNTGGSLNYSLTLDDTPPTIYPVSPNDSVVPSGTVIFKFNVTDNFDTSISCNISVDKGFNGSRALNATPNFITTTNITNISDGLHYWNVTCYDNINNNITSATLNFTAASIPTVKIDNPLNNSGFNLTDIVLYYNLSSSVINNCSLILNNTYYQTMNASDIPYKNNDGKNNFTLIGMNYGIYNWSVICFDVNNFNGTDATRIFHLDNQIPYISLMYPSNNQTLSIRNINFIFNVSDIDDMLVCNLTIDGLVNKTNISGYKNQNITVPVTNMNLTNHTWNVTCIDNVGFVGNSELWNFTLDSKVTVSLSSPANNTPDGDGKVNFTYTPSSAADFTSGICYLFIDYSIFDFHTFGLHSASPDTFVEPAVPEGTHSWYINCTDNNNAIGLSEIRTLLVYSSPPNVTVYYPNDTLLSNSSVYFNWSVTDKYDVNLTCNVTVNGTIKTPSNVNSPNTSIINRTYSSISDGLSYWNVTCINDAGISGTSALLNFTIEEPPFVALNNPGNLSRGKNRDIVFYYTPTDNSGNISTCSLIINNVLNATNNTITASGAQKNFTVQNIDEGVYNWSVNCSDSAGNTGYSVTRTFIIDLSGPIIALISPGEGAFLPSSVIFNWSATDYSGTNINCSLYIDGIFNYSQVKISGSYFGSTITNVSSGPHNWFVNCSDNLNNSMTSFLSNFSVDQPDLYLNYILIKFNNTNPDENDTVNITANVSNIGGTTASNVLVNFYDGNPSTGGILIGNSTGNVLFNNFRIFSVLWNITLGYHNIYVAVDPSNIISELDEYNNNASNNISILRSLITYPSNNTLIRTNITMNFTLEDFTANTLNYSIYVDNIYNGQNGSVTNNVSSEINVTLTQGLHYIKVQATDYLGRRKNSTALYVSVDYTTPQPVINTANNTWFNYTTPAINITVTDNFDTNLNYTLYVDSIPDMNVIGNMTNNSRVITNLSTLSNGYYQLILEAYDDMNNTANSTPKYIYVDTILPSVVLNTPGSGNPFNSRTVILNYSVTDNLAYNATCNITLDGSNVASQTINTSSSIAYNNTYTLTSIVEGRHYWNITCKDQALNTNISETRYFDVYMNPLLSLVSPPNNNWSNIENNTFYFNISDETGIENCSIIINSVIADTKTNSQIVNNVTNNFTINNMISGIYNWSVECYDNTTYHAYNRTINRTLYVDLESPMPYLQTLNNSWFKIGNPSITFNITDNLDMVLDYVFFVNGTPNTAGSVNNYSSISVPLTNLVNGTYIIVLEATDNSGNKRNSTPIIIYIDTIVPSINLTSVLNDTNVTISGADLNFTPTDNMASVLNCSLRLDGSVIASDMIVNNGYNQNVTVSGLLGGYHYWNVTCIDLATNQNISQTYRFYVVMPDLYINATINATSIHFSNNAPLENETINITAEIFNLGQAAAQDFIVQMRLNSMTGTLIYNSSINLSVGESINITTSYNIPIGDTTFYVLVDTPIATNGTIRESNESNNNASKMLHVGLWEYVTGLTSDKLAMKDIVNQTIYDWLVSNASGSKLFAADIDSNINWKNLQALGINLSNQSSLSDFYALDIKLSSTNLTDSVNRTYTLNGLPVESINYTMFTKRVNDVPIVNSTNNSNFKTGILWDYGDGGVKYTGAQDVVFVSSINKNTLGYNATVDYELRVPATLRSYKAGQDLVVFYAEIN